LVAQRNESGRQRGVLFERDANVRARFNLSEEISNRCRPKRVKLGDEVSTPSAINGLIAIGKNGC
jgi:hypothetical protein